MKETPPLEQTVKETPPLEQTVKETPLLKPTTLSVILPLKPTTLSVIIILYYPFPKLTFLRYHLVRTL